MREHSWVKQNLGPGYGERAIYECSRCHSRVEVFRSRRSRVPRIPNKKDGIYERPTVSIRGEMRKHLSEDCDVEVIRDILEA